MSGELGHLPDSSSLYAGRIRNAGSMSHVNLVNGLLNSIRDSH